MLALLKAMEKRRALERYNVQSFEAQIHGYSIKPLAENPGDSVSSFDKGIDEALEKRAQKMLEDRRAKYGRK